MPELVFVDRYQEFVFFDGNEIFAEGFLSRLMSFVAAHGGGPVALMVLEPHRVQYFNRHFGSYAVLMMEPTDAADAYHTAALRVPGDSPADAIGSTWRVIVFFSPKGPSWAIFVDNELELGVAAFVDSTLAASFAEHHGSLGILSRREDVEEFWPTFVRKTELPRIAAKLMASYGPRAAGQGLPVTDFRK